MKGCSTVKIFTERIKDLRIENGYKQEEIADKLNITTSAYGYYEQGRNETSLETVKEISDIYQVSTDYLFGKIGSSKQQPVYLVDDGLTLSENEIQVIKLLKESILHELSENPEENVERLKRDRKSVV